MIHTIRLQKFRSYADESFEFEPGVNIIVGPNASGKTNLLEALLVGMNGTSYKGNDIELISFEQPWTRIDLQTQSGPRVIKIKHDGATTAKQFDIDGTNLKRLTTKYRHPVILFEPNHLRLLTGSPELRRELLDSILSQTDSEFIAIKRRYTRALAQRNSLLKRGAAAKQQLFVWNIRLSELGGIIAAKRLELIELINLQITEIYRKIANNPEASVKLEYKTVCQQAQYGTSFLKKLEESVDHDIARGFTTTGPHRDDVGFLLNGHDASQTASRGETRSIALAMKLCELELVEKSSGTKPILLLDDVFSELDGGRRRALTEVMSGYQTFITTTDADVVVQHFMERCTIIPLGG